jgi:hypothetical protein
MTVNCEDKYDPLGDNDFDNIDDNTDEEEEEVWSENDKGEVLEGLEEIEPYSPNSSHDPEKAGTNNNDHNYNSDVPEDEDALWTASTTRTARSL